jgi:acyl-CoA synthetase (AMP-forming)/AMP-acid ligase II
MSTTPYTVRATLLAAADRALLFDRHGRVRRGAEIVQQADCIVGALAQACGPRPRVGLWYRNSLAAIEAFTAVEWAGGVRLPVDPGASAAEAEAIFSAAAVDIVIADREHAAQLQRALIVHDDEQRVAGAARAPMADYDADAPHMIYPRSVSGGRLFGITLSHGNWAATMDTNIALYRSGRYGPWHEPSEVYLTGQQLMHGTGFLGSFPFLAMGLPQVVLDTFEPQAALDAIERHRVTATMCVPAMLQALVDALASRPGAAATLRHVLYGGGPVSGEQIRSALQRIGPALTQVYGRVEGGWPLAMLDIDDHRALLDGHAGLERSCGRPIAEVRVALRPLPGEPAGSGELRVQGATTSRDYTDADGWCSLGDVMRVDEAGYLFYERRLDRMINTGYHVYPDEIESVIAGVMGVDAVHVRGEPHARWGQMVVAYVVPATAMAAGALADDVRRTLQHRLAKYKVPREIRIVEALPAA